MANKYQRQVEDKWQKIWKDRKTFQPDKSGDGEKFFATVAYPYANSTLHIGQGRTNTMADIYARYQRVKGKNVLFPMGFHITGTPVLAVADAIVRGDEKQIEATREAVSDFVQDKNEQDKILESFKDYSKIADFFSSKIEETFDSIGLGIDWSRQFTTNDKEYNKFIEWQFYKLRDQGVLTKGNYPVLYSPPEENAVGEDDIKDGDTDKVTISEMTYILFKVEGTEEYIATATLRPDALFGTTNLWMDDKIELVKLKLNNKICVVSKDTQIKLKHQNEHVEFIENVSPENYISKNVFTPITGRKVPIVKVSGFLDSKHGTGIVYSSPAGSPQDFIALIEAKNDGRIRNDIDVINTVENYDKNSKKIVYQYSCPAEAKNRKYGVVSSNDSESLDKAKEELYKEEHYGGVLNERCGDFQGIPVKDAKKEVFEKLVKEGLGERFYETSRKAITRTGHPVIVAVLKDQWFLDYSNPETKKKAFDVLDNMEYMPERLRSTQKNFLEWVHLRPCARKRGLGTNLPFDRNWVIEALSDSTIYQMYYLMAKVINRDNISPEKLTSELFDYVLLGEGTVENVARNTGIKKQLIEEMREEVIYWKSFDLRYTNPPHMSNHLSFLIYHYGIIFPKEYWPKKITIGGLLIKDGEKISKSKGNGIPLIRIKSLYGADLYRLYVGLGANYDVEMDFREEEIFQLEKKFETWKLLLSDSLSSELRNYNSLSQLDKWLISKFYSKVRDYFNLMEEMRIREAFVGILYEFLNDINYHQRRVEYERTKEILRFILEDYLILMTPVVPHICEELNEHLGNTQEISLKLFYTDYENYIDKNIENVEKIGHDLISNITRIKEQNEIEDLKKIIIIQAKDERFELFDELNKILKYKMEAKEVFDKLKNKFPGESKFISKFVPKTLGNGLDYYLSKQEEKEYIESLRDFIEREFCAELELKDADEEHLESLNIIPGVPKVKIE